MKNESTLRIYCDVVTSQPLLSLTKRSSTDPILSEPKTKNQEGFVLKISLASTGQRITQSKSADAINLPD